jgi:hypothetical protein
MIIAHKDYGHVVKDAVECDEQTNPRVDHIQMTRPKSQTINTHAHGKYVSVSFLLYGY